MKIVKFEDEESWLDWRLGKITGTRAGNLIGKRDGKPKRGYYELIAERVALPSDGENPMERGKRLEDLAIERFKVKTKKRVNTDLVVWHREDDENIAVSPDGYIETTVKKVKKITEAVECKCLNSAAHIEAWLTKEIPTEYESQVIQYFVVNDDLERLHFCFYDPRMPLDFFYITMERTALQEKIDEYLQLEKQVLAQVAEIESQLTF